MIINDKVSIDEKYEIFMLTEHKYKVLVEFLNQLVDDYSMLEDQFKDWTNFDGVSLNKIIVVTSLKDNGDIIMHINIIIEVDYLCLGKRYDFRINTSDSDDDFLHRLCENVYDCDYNNDDDVPAVHYDSEHKKQLLGLYLIANFTSNSEYNDGDYLANRVALNIDNYTEDMDPQDWDIKYTIRSLYGDYYDNSGVFIFTEDEVLKWKSERKVHYLESILDKHNITY